jgi:hypothetical protein
MFRVFRPSSEVVNEGGILYFVSGDRRFEISDRIILEINNSIIEEPTFENQPLTRKISKWFFNLRQVYARFWEKMNVFDAENELEIFLPT